MTRFGAAARSRWLWTALAVAATVGVQLVSAVPEPGYFAGAGGSGEIEASVSRALFAPGEAALNFLHFPAFVLVGWLWCRAAGAWMRSRAGALAAGVAIASLFAIGNEMSQAYVPTRHASGVDALVDLAGIALGAWVCHRGTRVARRAGLSGPAVPTESPE